MKFVNEANAFVTLIKNISKLFKFVHKSNNKTKINNTDPYYYEEYNKKVYVKANGDGVIVCSVKLHVNNIVASSKLSRTFDISDAKVSTEFPDFDDMLQNGNSNPFNEFGLWYWSDNDIVTDLKEHYDSESERSRHRLKNKFLGFEIILNQAALEKDKVYKIIFALSIPGLYPIKDGRFDGTIQEHKDYGNYETSLHIYNTKKLSYSVYMEQGIVFLINLCQIAKIKMEALIRIHVNIEII